MRTDQVLALLATTFAFVLMMLAHFLPMHSYDDGTTNMDASMWGGSGSTTYEVMGFGGTQNWNEQWHDSSMDDADGINELRAAGPLLAVATSFGFFALMASILNFKSGVSFGLMVLTLIFVILALVLYEVGADKADFPGDHSFGFGIMIGAIALCAMGTIAFAAPMARNPSLA